jgi:AcrR family transcriptional regulator
MNSSSPRRRYSAPKRRAQALATRQAILDAAERLFSEPGFRATTMEMIGQAAGVSVATVYLHFPNRTAIVEAMADAVVAAPDLNVEQVVDAPDPEQQVRIGARIIADLNERSWLIADILRDTRGSDESLARLWSQWQDRHLYAVRRAVESLAASEALRPGLDVDTATDILYALMGTDVYRALVRERGWTREQYETWLAGSIGRELLT